MNQWVTHGSSGSTNLDGSRGSWVSTCDPMTVLRPFVRDYRVSWYQKKHSPTHHPDHHPIFISFFHLPQSIASSLFKLGAWQFFCTTSFHVLFGLPLGLEPSTSYSIHFFTQSVSSFFSTCPYHCSLFCCSINITCISSIPSLSLNLLLGTLSFYLNITHPSDHSHLCSLKCHLIFFPDRPGLTSVQHTTLHTAATVSYTHLTLPTIYSV